MSYVVKYPSVPPLAEPVTLQEMKTWLGVSDKPSDGMISALISAAGEGLNARTCYVSAAYVLPGSTERATFKPSNRHRVEYRTTVFQTSEPKAC
jgi:hypothetical protein